MNWYPLKLTTPVRNHVFGGRRIQEQLGKRGLQPRDTAETWEVSDVEGSGGTVKNGPLAGQSLHDLTLAHPAEVVGPGWSGPHFPLLTKFIDGSGMLPVHLHANDGAAQQMEGQPNGKTEAWHILWAAPDATILVGVKDGVTPEELRSALLDQDYDRVMARHRVQAGDTVYVPGGVLHSFGPNTLIYEIEQTSNIQQQAMPWQMEDGQPIDRQTQEGNIDALIQELRVGYAPQPQAGLTVQEDANTRCFCCAGPYFALERWTLNEPYRHTLKGALILSNLGEPLEVRFQGGVETLGRAESVLLPAALGEVELSAPGEVLAGYLPDLERDVRAPLRAAGYSDDQIASLGDVSAQAASLPAFTS